MATIKDVARLAGVSVATVSRVINNSPKASEASRQSVGAAMETLNYHPNANARALAQQSTETVGLVVGDVSDPFFGAMVKAVEQVAYNTGNFLLIGNGYHNLHKELQAIEQLIRHRCAALVVHAKMIPDDELASLMQQIPGMVLINRILPGFEQRCVALETLSGAMDVAAFDWSFPCALLIGNERFGINLDVVKQCDAVVRIPLFGRKNSLNVVSALAIALHTARRCFDRATQRR